MPFVAGDFSKGGVRSADELGVMAEFFRVQLAAEKSWLLQRLLFMARPLMGAYGREAGNCMQISLA